MPGWKKCLLAVVTFCVAIASLAAAVVSLGLIDVSAANAGGPQDKLLGYASTQSIRHHAPKGENPVAHDDAALKNAVPTYKQLCSPCHGGPGMPPADFAQGLHPPPPDLSSPQIQAFTDGMLFQTISGGIASTGMPSFAHVQPPQTLWALVSVVRHLKELPGQPPAPAPSAAKPSGEPHQPGHPHRVVISGMKFAPPTLEVAVGDEVEFENQDFVAHTATANDGSFDTGKIDPSQVKKVTVKKAGQLPYYCRYHSSMKGELTAR